MSLSAAYAAKKRMKMKDGGEVKNERMPEVESRSSYEDVPMKDSVYGGKPDELNKDSKVKFVEADYFNMASGGLVDKIVKARKGSEDGDAKERMRLNEEQYPMHKESDDIDKGLALSGMESKDAYSEGGEVAHGEDARRMDMIDMIVASRKKK